VKFTYGLKLTGKYIHLKGSPAYASVIYTNAGYGLYIVDCQQAIIEGLIITGGQRDSNKFATDASIVAIRSKVRIMDNLLFANIGDSALVSKLVYGIMGVCAREGSFVFIFNNQIARNSWHGVGVFRDAEATITGNVIDGVDKASDEEVLGGRGTGIIVTRNARANIEANVIKRYWSGIGVYVNAQVKANGNLLEDIGTWGISIWDADTGRPVAKIEKNVVYKTGACGLVLARYLEGDKDPGYIKDNIFVETAQNRDYDSPDKYCFQCPLAVEGRPENFIIENNLFYKNFWMSPCNSSRDVPIGEFIQELQTNFSTFPLQWYAGYSEFIQRFYLYLGSEK
jgi:hypothetical protein